MKDTSKNLSLNESPGTEFNESELVAKLPTAVLNLKSPIQS